MSDVFESIAEQDDLAVALWLETNPDVNIRDRRSMTVLMCLLGAGMTTFIPKVLELGGDVNAEDNNGHSVLDTAVSADPETLKYLILAGARVDHVGGISDATPFHLIAAVNNEKAIDVLLDAGADINVLDKFRSTPLTRACMADKHDPPKIQHLIERGADLTLIDHRKDTTLHLFVEGRYPEFFHECIKQGVDINARNDYGGTPLFRAAEIGDYRCVKALLSFGPDPFIRSNAGILPSEIARDMSIRQLLEEYEDRCKTNK